LGTIETNKIRLQEEVERDKNVFNIEEKHDGNELQDEEYHRRRRRERRQNRRTLKRKRERNERAQLQLEVPRDRIRHDNQNSC
jgi:hypothetical protein